VEEAEAAIAALHNRTTATGCTLEVRFALQDTSSRVEASPPPSDSIYCKNLPQSFQAADLHQLFSAFGPVLTCRVLYHSDTLGHGGAALVRMTAVDDAVRAVQVGPIL
jgi:RNA recognition motif-containing protein